MNWSVSSRIGSSVMLAIVLCMAALLGDIWFMAERQDRQAATAEHKMVEGGFHAMRAALGSLTNDYAWWDDLFINAPLKNDEWMKTNMASGVYPNETVDFAAILDGDFNAIYAWDKGGEGVSKPELMDTATLGLIKTHVTAQSPGKHPASFEVSSPGGKLSLLAFTRILPSDETTVKDPARVPILILGYHIDEARIATIGEQFLIPDLRLVQTSTPEPHFIAIKDASGGVAGYLGWTASRPGATVLKSVALPIAVLTVALMSAAFFLSGFAKRQADELARRETEASHRADLAQAELVESERMAELGKLTATVAHEIRNPLGAVRTSSFLLRRKLGNASEHTQAFDRIENGIKRCDDIISQLLDFVRSRELMLAKTNFDDWIEQTVREESNSIPESVQIECQLNTEGTEAEFDPERLRKVLVNLLHNAAEAMASAKGPAKIVIESTRTGRGYEIAVSDNGPGIDDDHQKEIFKPFFTTKNFGTGLGLPASVNIMKNHRGGLEVQSEPGKGSRFTAWLPAAADSSVSEAA